MAIVVKPNTFVSGTTIVAAEHNANYDTIYNDYNGNITDDNIAVGANISISKIDFTGVDIISKSITQATHGFAVSDVIEYSGGAYGKAQADALANASVVGIVSNVADANTFTLTMSGYVSGLSGLTANSVHYLDESTAGDMTTTKPSATGEIVKPILTALSTSTAVVNIGDSTVVGSDVPAGVILIWSGALGAIPSGWSLCDGTGSTPDLSDKFVIGVKAAGTAAVDDTGGSALSGSGANILAETAAAGGGSNPSNGGGTPFSESTHKHDFMPPYYALAYIMKD